MPNDADTAGQLFVGSRSEDDFFAGLYGASSLSHSLLEEAESAKIVAMVRENLMLRDFRLVAFFGVLDPFRALDDVFRKFSSPGTRAFDLFTSSRKC